MAEKTTKKPTLKSVKATEVKTTDDLRSELSAKRAEQLEQKRSHAAGELVNPLVLRSTRKAIARLETVLRAAELKQNEESAS